MDRHSLYEIYQENIVLLENELDQVKKMTQINLGKYYYEKNTTNIQGTIKKLEYDILASPDVQNFLNTNNNIQKLDLLYNVYKIIAEIISML